MEVWNESGSFSPSNFSRLPVLLAEKSRHQILQWRFLWSEFDAVQFPPTERHVDDLDFQFFEVVCRKAGEERIEGVRRDTACPEQFTFLSPDASDCLRIVTPFRPLGVLWG